MFRIVLGITDTDTEVGIQNTEYRRKNTEKKINRYFNFYVRQLC